MIIFKNLPGFIIYVTQIFLPPFKPFINLFASYLKSAKVMEGSLWTLWMNLKIKNFSQNYGNVPYGAGDVMGENSLLFSS